MKICIYTAIFGSYENLLNQPKFDDVVDIAFVDRSCKNSKSWSIIEIVPSLFNDPRRDNRMYKLLPHEHLPYDVEYSVYLDGNIIIRTDPKKLIDRYLTDCDIAFLPHPDRNCAYDEARICAELGLDDESTITQQMNRYRRAGYPEQQGLLSGGVILRRHTESVVRFNEFWWSEVKKGSVRDQLSLNYSLWSTDVKYGTIGNRWVDESNDFRRVRKHRGMEFDKYKKHGDYHWRQYKTDTIYRQHALKVRDWVTESNVLDIGAGDGLITHLLKCKGIDNNKRAIRLAKKHGVKVAYGSVYTVSGEYDAVYLGDVLEHLDHPETALKQITKVTKILYVATPPRQGELRPYHVYEWTPVELAELLERTGWHVLSSEVANERIYMKCERRD